MNSQLPWAVVDAAGGSFSLLFACWPSRPPAPYGRVRAGTRVSSAPGT